MNDDKRIQSHRDLTVWQLGMEIAESVYELTRVFPKEETYGLTSQLRRAIVSVPANIAEGNARSSTKEYLHLLSIAVASLWLKLRRFWNLPIAWAMPKPTSFRNWRN